MDSRAFSRPGVVWRAIAHVVVYAFALSMLIPFVWMVLTSLKTDLEAGQMPTLATILPQHGWQWENYRKALETAQLGDFYWMSTSVAVVTTVLAVAHNLLAGYAFAKLRFRGKRILFGMTLATMMLPIQVFFIFAYVICSWLGYVDNFQALVVPFLVSGFGIFYMRQAISSVPDDLIDAARMDGMGEFDIVWMVVRPIVWPSIAALGIFSFVNSWNSFFWPLIVIDSLKNKTLPLAIADLSNNMYFSAWPVTMAAGTMLVVPLVLVFFLAQRAFVQGVAMTGLKE
ncbi:MAG: carbohydrate ABC transporter permease [Phycisphaeraceae bacterium]|nr:carbohydrate ABC transporter permease [Phycisphaeraceae bacterium]MCW5762869.1 carbohydrate ABC transporter permease [Phycisphaeraceae bacterium]